MNWAVEDEEHARRDRVRMKQLTAILIGYGYAILAASLWQPLAGEGRLGGINLILAAIGLAMHASALNIAPRGEPS